MRGFVKELTTSLMIDLSIYESLKDKRVNVEKLKQKLLSRLKELSGGLT